MDASNSPDTAEPELAARPERQLDPAVRELVAEVFADGSATLRTEDGADLRATRVTTYRDLILVHVPRLALDSGLVVTGTCETPHPWSVTFVVREVDAFSASSDTAALEAVALSLYPERRREPRVEVGGEATITVHYGVEMVEAERLRAVLVDVSRGGLAFATSADLAVGTQVGIDARLLLGHLDVDVVVRWRGASRVPEMHHYGCELVRPHAAGAAVLARLVEAAPATTDAVNDGSLEHLRRSFDEQPHKRRFMRRRSGADD
jgi:hypothetical protein